MWLNRFRDDFSLALVVTFGIITNLVILPFAIYRLSIGQTLVGIVDLLIITCITVGSTRAYVSGRTRGASLFLAVTYSIGCVAVAYLGGMAGALWMYAVVLSNFLLVDQRRAVVLSAAAIAAVAASPIALPALAHKAIFVGSSIVVSLFAFFFTWRTNLQRNQLESLASLDPLTGACNRRGMHAEIAIAIASHARSRAPLGLIIFDLDHFKRVNDRFGHEAGDVVLVQMASVVRRNTRKGDRLFRLGGEEFALLLPDTDTATLHEVAEKIRLAIARDVSCGGLPVTASFGAGVLRDGESEAQWRERVDAAMYRAKHEGRNRTVTEPELQPPDRIGPGSSWRTECANDTTIDRPPSADARSGLGSLLPPPTRTPPTIRHFGR